MLCLKNFRAIKFSTSACYTSEELFMAKRSSKEADYSPSRDLGRTLAFVLFFLAIVITFSLFGTNSVIGNFVFNTATSWVGVLAYALPFVLVTLGYLLYSKKMNFLWSKKGLLTTLFLSALFLMISYADGEVGSLGGRLGGKIITILNEAVGTFPAFFLIFAAWVGSVFGILEKKISFENFKLPELRLPEMPSLPSFSKNNDDEELEYEDEQPKDVREELLDNMNVDVLTKEERERVSARKVRTIKAISATEEEEAPRQIRKQPVHIETNYERPPASLYEEDSGKPSAGDNKENARLIKRTMQNFGISVEMDEVSVGPTVTRYCLKPAQGVKLNRIAALDKNLAMELSTTTVRIEAPVPGKSVVGIEIPNKTKAMIGLGTMFADSRFLEDKRPLLMAIGKDIAGEPTYADLGKMPHLLVAGMTGAGKSVMVHTLIHSLIYRNSPEDLKFIMIDPKKVELSFYQKLPHLYTPVIKEPKKAVQTLNWLVHEMERRYEVLEEFGKQNIAGYHALAKERYQKAESSKRPVMEELPERMPYIIVVIDELADFMMAYPKEMESGIVRLAQKSRAVGIHLILSTQKPLASIVSSVIKANVPGRIALKVSSRVDSMVIIDQIGAEKLLGYGDLLLVSSDGGDAKRIQSPYISEKEIIRVIDFLKSRYNDYIPEELTLPGANGTAVAGAFNSNGYSGDEFQDDRFEEAKEIVLTSKNASTTFLQRKMGVGYARAAKLIDALEASGIIGPANGSKPREILVGAGAGGALMQSSEDLEAAADELLGEDEEDR